MTGAQGPTREELERAAKVASELSSDRVGALVADVLGRQADGGSQFTGRKPSPAAPRNTALSAQLPRRQSAMR